MNTKSIQDLLIDPNNPKTVSDFQGNNLANSLNKYGSLDGIIFNRRLGKLAGGNTRTQLLMTKLVGNNRVVYTAQYDVPDEQGTVAIGNVWHNNMPIPYREVEWSEVTHREASIAAGKIHGDFVDELLAEANQFIIENNGDIFDTGQSEEEVNELLASLGPDLETEPKQKKSKNDDGLKPLHVRFTDDQLATLYEAIGAMKRARQLSNEKNTDLDANALYYICRHYVETATSHNIETTAQTPTVEASYQETPSSETQSQEAPNPQPPDAQAYLTSIPTEPTAVLNQ